MRALWEQLMVEKMRQRPLANMRTVTNGKVWLHHKRYTVSQAHQKYRGELDGLRFAFYSYKNGSALEPYICLIDTEERYRERDEDSTLPQPHVMEDGLMPWQWWDEAA